MTDKAFYGDFEQIEHGSGLTTKFLHEAFSALEETDCFVRKKAKKFLLVCGVSAAKTLRELVAACNEKLQGVTVELLPVKNDFFGETVTCTGLLTGTDIARAVEEYKAAGGSFDELVLSGNTLKEFEDVFLCGMTLDGLKKRLKTQRIRVNRSGGYGLIEIITK